MAGMVTAPSSIACSAPASAADDGFRSIRKVSPVFSCRNCSTSRKRDLLHPLVDGHPLKELVGDLARHPRPGRGSCGRGRPRPGRPGRAGRTKSTVAYRASAGWWYACNTRRGPSVARPPVAGGGMHSWEKTGTRRPARGSVPAKEAIPTHGRSPRMSDPAVMKAHPPPPPDRAPPAVPPVRRPTSSWPGSWPTGTRPRSRRWSPGTGRWSGQFAGASSARSIDADDAFQAAFLVLLRGPRSIRRAGSAGQVAVRRRLPDGPPGVAAAAIGSGPRADCWTSCRSRPGRTTRPATGYRCSTPPCSGCRPSTASPSSCANSKGLSRREASARLGLTEGTLSSRLGRARDLLRRKLGPYGFPLAIGTAVAPGHRP